ncbi:hypothetical protein [Enterobacter bugandensis]|uniref:hypothetical protein n=1 Tax=Enterobacter bugandensis TaxID=881260 RepID=UPI002FD320BE
MPVSHLQLVAKLQDKNPENYVGFSFLDVRGIRRDVMNFTNKEVSMLYGASRSLNTKNVNLINDDVSAKEFGTNKESFKNNKGIFTYHLPIELRRHILEGICEIVENHPEWPSEIQKELLRDDYDTSNYDKLRNKKTLLLSFVFSFSANVLFDVGAP